MQQFILFFLRLFGPRWGISPAVADYLEAAARLDRENQIPRQLVPIGARLWARGWLNKKFFDSHRDWVLPYWAVHQLDPADRSFVARGLQPILLNSTHRDWTAIGNPASPREAIVDPRGLVTPQYDGWSLDAWLQVDGEIYFPSRMESPIIEQKLANNLPVIRTRYDAAGLRVTQEAFAFADEARQEWVLAAVTIENPRGEERSATLYFSVRPFNPEGVSLVKQVEFRTGDGGVHSFWINGSLGGLIPQPDGVGCSKEESGDVASQIPHLDGSTRIESAVGVATAAAEFRVRLLPHTSRVLTSVMPMSTLSQARAETTVLTHPDELVRLERTVEAGWRELLSTGMRIRIPDDRMQDAFDANRAYLLLLHDGDSITPGPFTYHEFWFRDGAYLLNALAQLGYHAQVKQVLKTFPQRLQKDGYFLAEDGEWDANGEALWTLVEHARLSGDLELLADQYWQMLNAAHWIDAKRQVTKEGARGQPQFGLLPAGMSAEHLGPNDVYYWDDFWGLAGLRSAEYAAHIFAKEKDDSRLRAALEAYWADVNISLAKVAERTQAAWIPASPFRGADSAMVANLAACYPLQLLAADDPRIIATLDELKRVAWQEETFFHHVGHSGFGTYLSLHVAGCYLYRRSAEAWPIIRWVLDHASSTLTWPEAIHPLSRHGGMGDGHHGWAAADWISVVRNALLFEEGQHLVLTPSLPQDWTFESQSIQVESAATHFGDVSFTLAFGDHAATLVIKAAWREPPEFVEWNLPFELKESGGDRPGVELLDNCVRIASDVRKVVATW
jgi:hypothetical protein